MTFDRSVSAIARTLCRTCNGSGLRAVGQPCNCVLRNIFRACYARFRQQAEGRFRRPSTYVADFVLVGQRALKDSPVELGVFKFHFLLAGDWKMCCKRLGISRGDFFHAVYRTEEQLGRAYAELTPYALYPLREYTGFHLPNVQPCPVSVSVRRDAGPVRPPLAARAEPTQTPCTPRVVPAPVPAVVNIREYVRGRFRSGLSTRAIAADLDRSKIPAPKGEKWGIAAVRAILLGKVA